VVCFYGREIETQQDIKDRRIPMRNFPDTLIQIIEQSDLNINRISQVSGISNTYLIKLLKGRINRPGKDKIASVLLALNYRISQINPILAEYDYMPLNAHDIPDILKNNRKRKFEGRIVPQFDYIYFELAMAALEAMGGSKIMVKNRPSGIFIPMDLYMMKEFPTEANDEAARFFMRFTHDIVMERKALFMENCARGFRYETYICKDCLGETLEKNIGPDAVNTSPVKRDLYIRYFANAVSASLKFPDQQFHQVINRCARFEFIIQDAHGKNPKVSFTSDRKHSYSRDWDQLNMEGFLSNAPEITDLFFNEIEKCRNAVDETDSLHTPEGFHAHIRALFDTHGQGRQFDRALAELMEYQGLKFY
jgi:transcriptional regulator with XRE-family HTH domain